MRESEDLQWFSRVLEVELRDGVRLSELQVDQLYRHYELLKVWNSKINLTSLKPGAEMVVRHYCESLFFGSHIPGDALSATIADIGSGAGFPGVPLAILKPDWHIWLVESNRRKAVFLAESARNLENVSVVAQRAEQVKTHFDWIVSRAVDPSKVLENVPRLASRVGLMIGESDFSTIKLVSGVAWGNPDQLPWGDRRICVYGVSRGTK